MSDINPWKRDPLPTAQVVKDIAHEALQDWIARAKLPYPVRVGEDTVELRAREMFYIQSAVALALTQEAPEINAFLKENLRR